MEQSSLPLLNVVEDFQIEIFLKDTKYPFSKAIAKLLLKKYCSDIILYKKKLEILKNKLDEITKDHFKNNKIIIMRYCKTEKERSAFEVYLVNDYLCFKRENEFIKIDTVKIFKNHFENRSPLEDDKYLTLINHPINSGRLKKSCFSCFVIAKNKKLYISPYRMDTMQHTFTTNGKRILSAGMILLKNGKIVYIDTTSGHYQGSNKHLELFFKFLKKNKCINLKNYFIKEFNFNKENFSNSYAERIEKKESGINFRYLFREKTKIEKEEERIIRKKIVSKYLSDKNINTLI